MKIYLDASAVLRILFGESGSRAPRAKDAAFSSQILRVETARAIERAHLAGRIDAGLRARKTIELGEVLKAISVVPVSEDIVAIAAEPFGIPVRALDAIHIATAIYLQSELGEPVDFWTHDAVQARAAVVRALAVRGIAV